MWYQEGEKSTKYFLNLEKSNSKMAEMNGLKNQGDMIYDEEEIDKMVENFYRSLYEKGDTMIRNRDKLDGFLGNMKQIDKQKND